MSGGRSGVAHQAVFIGREREDWVVAQLRARGLDAQRVPHQKGYDIRVLFPGDREHRIEVKGAYHGYGKGGHDGKRLGGKTRMHRWRYYQRKAKWVIFVAPDYSAHVVPSRELPADKTSARLPKERLGAWDLIR